MPTPVCFTPAFRLIPGGKYASFFRIRVAESFKWAGSLNLLPFFRKPDTLGSHLPEMICCTFSNQS